MIVLSKKLILVAIGVGTVFFILTECKKTNKKIDLNMILIPQKITIFSFSSSFKFFGSSHPKIFSLQVSNDLDAYLDI